MITITWIDQHVVRIQIDTIISMTVITIDFMNEQINIAQEANVNWVNNLINLVDDGTL